MKGIYKYTNIINGKIYIGQSIHLRVRELQHKNRYNDENDSEYYHSFHSALRKYGYENFLYEILVDDDSLTSEDLDNLEIYYISFYDSYNNGYNEDKGGSNALHPRKLSEEKVSEIKWKMKNTDITFTQLSEEYDVSLGMISDINKGNHWGFVDIDKYTYPIRDTSINQNKGERHPRAHFTNEEVLKIRIDFMTKSLNTLYEENKEKCPSFATFKKIVYGTSFPDVPYYKKREKKWYKNGTCIDYSPEGK